MHFLFIAGVGKTHQPPHDLQLKNCIKTNIYFLYYNVNIFLKIMSKKYCVVLINPSAAHKVRQLYCVDAPFCLRCRHFPRLTGESPCVNGRHNSVNYILACFRSFISFGRRNLLHQLRHMQTVCRCQGQHGAYQPH